MAKAQEADSAYDRSAERLNMSTEELAFMRRQAEQARAEAAQQIQRAAEMLANLRAQRERLGKVLR